MIMSIIVINDSLARWRQTPDTDQVIIHHNVTNYEFFYEPFYIARDDAPAHDERFIGWVLHPAPLNKRN